MKPYCFIIILIGAFSTGMAQNPASQAKAAYLLAEESFEAGNYLKSIDYLKQSRTSLGQSNCKILYLQIMAELELSKKDPEYLHALELSIAEFFKAPDLQSFNEEKSLEVMKLKIQVKEMKSTAAQEAIKAKENTALAAAAFKNWTWQNWPMHIALRDLKALKKDEPVFLNSSKGRDSKAGIELIYTPFLSREKEVQGIYLKNEMVVGYRVILAYGGTAYKTASYGSEAILKELYDHTADSLSRVFGFAPDTPVPAGKFYSFMKKEYCWARDGKVVRLLYDADQGSKNWYARIFIDSQELKD